MRGMTSSQVLFLSLRFNLYREALERREVRELFDEAGIDFDPQVAKRWEDNLSQSKTIQEVFKPIPAEAFKGGSTCLVRMAARYLFDAPKSAGDAAWRIASTAMLMLCLAIGYGVVARPALVRAVIGVETVQRESIEHRLIRILEKQQSE